MESILRFITPLYPRNDEALFESFRNAEWIINYFVDLGVPIEKVMLGITLTGNSYKINKGQNSLGSPVKGIGLPGKVNN